MAIGRQLYAIGSYDGSAMGSVMVFDTETEQWERREDLPFGLSPHSLATDGDSIYLFGDYERRNVADARFPRRASPVRSQSNTWVSSNVTEPLYGRDRSRLPKPHRAARRCLP